MPWAGYSQFDKAEHLIWMLAILRQSLSQLGVNEDQLEVRSRLNLGILVRVDELRL